MFLIFSSVANATETIEKGMYFYIRQTSQRGVGATTSLWMCKTTITQKHGSLFAMFHYGSEKSEFKNLCTTPRKSAKLVSNVETKLKEAIQKCPKGLEKKEFYNFCKGVFDNFSI